MLNLQCRYFYELLTLTNSSRRPNRLNAQISSRMMPEQAARRVNSTDSQKDLAGALVKLKWFTPRITEMIANETRGNKGGFYRETTFFFPVGPS